MSEFARTMLTAFPIQGILDHLVTRIVEIMPITGAGVTLISADLKPRYIAASNDAALRFERLQAELGEGPCLAAYRTATTISVPDLRSDQQFPKFSPRAVEVGLGAVFAFPLRHDEHQLGALDLCREAPGSLSSESLRDAQTLADVAAAYLINAQARADLQDASDRSRVAALHDGLTGLPNRALILERLEHAILRGRRSGKTAAVFFIDVDDFKTINDSRGHQAGDELLIAIAQRLTSVLRPGDTLARLAGDEFVILCEDLEGRSQADALTARFHLAMAQPFALNRGEASITASIGIAFTGPDDQSPEQLIYQADVAMYRMKRRGGGAPAVSQPRGLRLAEEEVGLADALVGAAGRGELRLAYQPIVTASDGRLAGAEALLRWTHPIRGSIRPAVFIPLAEHSGEIIEIGRWVIEQACRDRQRWHTQRSEQLAIFVNVSERQFMSAGFVETVASALREASIDPASVTLETSEGIFLRDDERAQLVLGELKRIGVKLALDDFGTGYSSLSRLTKPPIDTVKIDHSFIAHLGQEPSQRARVGGIIQLAHGLGMTVVAGGVERAEQHARLIDLKCDLCQGFYFARPMRAIRLETLIEHQPALRLPSSPRTTAQ